MKTLIKCSAVIGGVVILCIGCSKEQTSQTAATDLEKAFKINSASPPPAAPAPAASPSPIPAAPPPGDQGKQLVHEAVLEIRTNAYLQAFTTLRAAQVAPNITVDQYSAIESTRLALERDMAAKALAGDQNAQGALDVIRRMPR